MNGSKSSDDWAVTKWKWTRHETSLAVGNIAEKSDETPLLQLTDLVVGRYVFNLTVFDEQGLSDTDTVNFIVKSDPKLYYLVEITLDGDIKILTAAQYETLKGKLALLVQDGTRLQVRFKTKVLFVLMRMRRDRDQFKKFLEFYLEIFNLAPMLSQNFC